MPEYRLYKISRDGHIAGPPITSEWAEDRAAVAEAKQLLDGHDIEIWQGPRVVAYLTPDERTG